MRSVPLTLHTFRPDPKRDFSLFHLFRVKDTNVILCYYFLQSKGYIRVLTKLDITVDKKNYHRYA